MHDEEARKESVKAKQDWQFIGRFVGAVVQLFTIISAVFKEAKIGFEVIEWLIGSGKSFLEAKLVEIIEEFRRQNPLPAPKVEKVAIDTIIRVDRSIRPSYPDWVQEVMHPEFESTGPAEYDISAVEQWLHDGQKGGKSIMGDMIHNHLKETDMLKTCLRLRDLEEIQKKGIVFFQKYFKNKVVFGWAGSVWDRHHRLLVPYLYEFDGKVVLRWHWARNDWSDGLPALRFAK